VPVIAEFYGMAVTMYWRDHAPPHFHVMYGSAKALVRIADGEILAGKLPKTATRIVREWALAHQSELMQNWDRGIVREPFERIPGPDHD
jgi:hypothetical protein